MKQSVFTQPGSDSADGGDYVVKDANGFRLAYVYGRDEEAMRADHPTPTEARRIAQAITQLPELWRR